MKRLLIALGAAALLLLPSCRTARAPREPRVRLTNAAAVPLFPPALMEGVLDGPYAFRADFAGRAFDFPAYVQCDGGGLFVQAMNTFGASIMTLSYDGVSLSLETELLPASFRAEYIVMDVQLAYYNFDALREALERAGLSFVELRHEGTWRRELYDGDALVSEFTVDSVEGTLSVKNYLRGYEYSLALLPAE